MKKVLTAEEMCEVDRLTTEKYGISSILLMENAAHAAARIITGKLGGSVEGKSCLILCGRGNNGGDGAALARILEAQGGICSVFMFGKVANARDDARTNFEILASMTANPDENRQPRLESRIVFSEIDRQSILQFWERTKTDNFDAIVDGIFGTGLNRKVEGEYAWLLSKLSDWNRYEIESEENPRHLRKRLFVSLDLPSGLYADGSEQLGSTFQADTTVTFTAPKLANVLPPASNFNGELHIANIGSPQELIDNSPSRTFLSESSDARVWLSQTEFSPDSYKNKRGNVLLIVGSRAYSGAAVLAGNGAIQSGAGLVTIATPLSAFNSISERVLPEVIVHGVAESGKGSIGLDAIEKLKTLGEKADVIGIGSGLGLEEKATRQLVREIVTTRKTPIVIDADGLNALAPFDLEGSEDLPLILTPHEGEFLRLMGTEDKDALRDRVGAVRDFAQKHKVILVLKGERTLIAEPHGKVVINPTGNSGLGKAGNGDNLTGIITGFIAQGVKASVGIFESVIAAVYVAGFSADIAERKFGKRVMLASDVRDCLGEAFKEIGGSDEKF